MFAYNPLVLNHKHGSRENCESILSTSTSTKPLTISLTP